MAAWRADDPHEVTPPPLRPERALPKPGAHALREAETVREERWRAWVVLTDEWLADDTRVDGAREGGIG